MHKFQLSGCSTCSQRGFTLIEALIALVILAGGLLAMFRFHGTSIEVTGETKNRAAATALAQAKLEELRAFTTAGGYSARMVNGSEVNLASTDYAGVAYAATFTRAWVVTPTANPDVNQVAVTVTWPRRDNVAGSVMLSAIVAKADPQGGAEEIASAIENGGSSAPGDWPPGGSGGSPDVVVTEEDASGNAILDANGDPILDANGDPVVAVTYDLLFGGSFTTTNATLDSVDLSKDAGSTDTGRSCSVDVGALTYSCTITGIPINDSWLGTITFISSASGNSEGVCELIGSNVTTGEDEATLNFDKSSTSLASSSTPNISSIRVVKKASVGNGGDC